MCPHNGSKTQHTQWSGEAAGGGSGSDLQVSGSVSAHQTLADTLILFSHAPRFMNCRPEVPGPRGASPSGAPSPETGGSRTTQSSSCLSVTTCETSGGQSQTNWSDAAAG